MCSHNSKAVWLHFKRVWKRISCCAAINFVYVLVFLAYDVDFVVVVAVVKYDANLWPQKVNNTFWKGKTQKCNLEWFEVEK